MKLGKSKQFCPSLYTDEIYTLSSNLAWCDKKISGCVEFVRLDQLYSFCSEKSVSLSFEIVSLPKYFVILLDSGNTVTPGRKVTSEKNFG